nr:ketoacyl-ACP synthase III [Saprospiraceae bacterium]
MQYRYSSITGTGHYLPTVQVKNDDFIGRDFFDRNGQPFAKSSKEITEKFLEITTIAERRYVKDHLVTSDIAFFAAEKAIKAAGIDKEELDYIIVAHNFGDVKANSNRSDFVPSLAARVKEKLQINNPRAIAYDIAFGCPGWLQGVIQADYFIKSGDAHKALVIGSETLSRIIDPHDVDSMLYADGAGAVIMEGKSGETPSGILAHSTRSDAYQFASMLYMDKSYHPDKNTGDIYLKMHGRKLYQYALSTVPQAIKDCLDKSGVHLSEIKKVLIHQANGKMDDAILHRLYKLYGMDEIPPNVMPMTIAWLGNSSVATIPTLLDIVLKGDLPDQKIEKGDKLIFASVGAGMNINAMVYEV